MCEQIYITVEPFSLRLRRYHSIKLALQDSIILNNADDNHPAFELWELKKEIVKIGYLYRKFGTNDFTFINENGEKI